MMPMRFIYLHGFASGSSSQKGLYLSDRFRELNLDLELLDLNQEDFFQLTLTRQIEQTVAVIANSNQPVTLIGSSFGGLTAAWVAERALLVEKLVLLAPAFNFFEHLTSLLSAEQIQTWQASQRLLFYHYVAQTQLPLGYGFYQDLQDYDEQTLRRSLPTLILHGRDDEVVPLSSSAAYAEARPWVTLKVLESDHGLGNCLPQIWEISRHFCKLGDR